MPKSQTSTFGLLLRSNFECSSNVCNKYRSTTSFSTILFSTWTVCTSVDMLMRALECVSMAPSKLVIASCYWTRSTYLPSSIVGVGNFIVTHSAMAGETCEFAEAFDAAFVLKHSLERLLKHQIRNVCLLYCMAFLSDQELTALNNTSQGH
jgi:hypothetical protein